jgi:cyclase
MTQIAPLGQTLRILRPAPNVIAFYDGRVPGVRAYAETANWVDDGAYSLGVASYAVVDGTEALVYDTHISIEHAKIIRATLLKAGVKNIRVVLSHWHLDHIAGNAMFADCEMIAHRWTFEAMTQHKAAIETGTRDGLPAISPLILPMTLYDDELELKVGRIPVSLRHVDIHSRDGTLLVLPGQELLLAGDALEDTVTYLTEPQGMDNHLRDLARMSWWQAETILPNHGAPERIAAGGYDKGLITATQLYTERLLECRDSEIYQHQTLAQFVADEIERGWISYFAPYEAVHRENVAKVLAVSAA